MEHCTLVTTRSVAPSRSEALAVEPALPCAYNTLVADAHRQNGPAPKHHRHAVYAAETSGLLLIALLLLVLTVIRYWHAIHWSLR